MGTSSARPDDLDGFVRGSRAADDEFRGHGGRLLSAYIEFRGRHPVGAFRRELADQRVRPVHRSERGRRALGGADRRGVPAGRRRRRAEPACRTRRSRPACGPRGRTAAASRSPSTIRWRSASRPPRGYADDPVNTASGNFLIAEAELPVGGLAAGLTLRRTYNSRSDRAGAFGPGWSSLGRRPVARPRGRRRVRRARTGSGRCSPGRAPATGGCSACRPWCRRRRPA